MVTTDAQIAQAKTSFDLTSYLKLQQVRIEEALDSSLPISKPQKIYEAMRYSLLAGGKRLRPTLCIATCELTGGTLEMAMPTACALEMIHTMSLIHDDLPAMDNDDLRRGMPTSHVKFGEATAILAGDALLTKAFEMFTYGPATDKAKVLAIAELAKAAGAEGMVGGQAADMIAEGKKADKNTLDYIHKHKTGALIAASITCAAILCGANSKKTALFKKFGEKIGLAFQIADDILDIIADPKKLGKTKGKDQAKGKLTYPAVYGLEKSREEAKKLILEAKYILGKIGCRADDLSALADYFIERVY